MTLQKTNYGLTGVFLANWTAIQATNPDGSKKYKYIINEGSSRSSKTWSIAEVKHQLCEQNIGWRVTSWRDTKTDCKKTVWKDFQKMLIISGRMEYARMNKTESIYNYPTGSTFEIHGTDNEENVHGLTQNVAHLNEPYNISRYTFDQIDMRSDLMIIDWNPRRSHWIDDVKKLPNAIVIHSTFEDNPFCPPQQRKKILSYEPLHKDYSYLLKLTKEEAKKKVNSLKLTDTDIFHIHNALQNEYNSTADAWMWSVYGLGEKAERPNRIFHFNEIPDSEYFNLDKPIYYGCDWGKVHNMGVIEVKTYDNDIYVHEINYDSENTMQSNLTATERRQIDKNKEEGFIEWLFKNKWQLPYNRPIVCDNNRKHKIIALREIGYDYAIACRKFPGSLLDNIDILTNLNVYYTKSSVNFKYEQENYSRKVDKRSGEVLEEPEDANDHLMQPLSYVVRNLYDNDVLTKF